MRSTLRSAWFREPSREFDQLDGLRGAAVLAVMGHHFALIQALDQSDGWVGNVAAGLGRVGVATFFVLSGFVIWLPVSRAIAGGTSLPAAASFVVRRAARVLPAYWVAVVVQHWWIAESRLADPSEFATHLALMQTLEHGGVFRGILVAWTLSIEITFYAFVAVFLAGFASRPVAARRFEPVVIAALLVVPWLVRGWIVFASDIEHAEVGAWWSVAAWVPSWFWWSDAFAAGMLLARLVARPASIVDSVTSVTASLAFGAFVAVGLLVEGSGWFGTPIVEGSLTSRFWEIPVRLLVVVPLVGLLVIAPDAAPGRLLRSPLIRFLGTVSFGLYLWHVAAIRVVRDNTVLPGSLLLRGLVAFGLSIALAAASWYALERPLIRRARGSRPGHTASVTEQPTTIARPSAR